MKISKVCIPHFAVNVETPQLAADPGLEVKSRFPVLISSCENEVMMGVLDSKVGKLGK